MTRFSEPLWYVSSAELLGGSMKVTLSRKKPAFHLQEDNDNARQVYLAITDGVITICSDKDCTIPEMVIASGYVKVLEKY